MLERQQLTTGGDDPFLPHLLDAIHHANEIELAVAFIKASGLRLILDALYDAISSDETEVPRASLRVVTTDYMGVTDPEALRMLMLLKERGAEVKVFSTQAQSFHMKAYIFVRHREGQVYESDAFVGSSNVTKSALTSGLEWNYRVHADAQSSQEQWSQIKTMRHAFNDLFDDTRSLNLQYEWIERYEQSRPKNNLAFLSPSFETEPDPTPEPNEVQRAALQELNQTREQRYRRGLVVMATGLGKTWLAAFDSVQVNAKRVLFVAHREEILMQAETTFLNIMPQARVGYYTGKQKDESADVLCASVQTLGRAAHLQNFPSNHFDYIVVDEFHHAAASTYRALLAHFAPRFLLGLTATPERTDQSDILSLCDDNLVFDYGLFKGIESTVLAPFHYHGILDESVDYDEIPWRNSQFDPALLSNKLATLSRAKHSYNKWLALKQQRTLAFCISKKHAAFMADKFIEWGVKAAAVYGGSDVTRAEGLSMLERGELEVIFSVDLFNEGVDLPAIDTVMMLRPTESKVMFLQQLGRGLRRHKGKSHLVVLDFIGNHKGFFNKPQALFGVGATHKALADFANKVKAQALSIPDGCFVNYDIGLIDFMASLDEGGLEKAYQALKDSLNRRPTLTEFYRAGCSLTKMRQHSASWWQFVAEQGDLDINEQVIVEAYVDFFREVETTSMNKSFKMVVLESLIDHDGFSNPMQLNTLAESSREVFSRRRILIKDIKEELQDVETVQVSTWFKYWSSNPINAWVGGNRAKQNKNWFSVEGDLFVPNFVAPQESSIESFQALLRELVDFRYARYLERNLATVPISNSDQSNVSLIDSSQEDQTELPFFPNIKIACGHFKTGHADTEEYIRIGSGYGRVDPARHFIARASGNSMNGGKRPVHDGDYLLLERITPSSAGSISNQTIALEKIDETGDGQYLLREVKKDSAGNYRLVATNPNYDDLLDVEGINTFARLKAVISPLELARGKSFIREEVPALFGEEFNVGNWQSGHVALNDKNAHILFVTLNKQGKAEEHRYMDYFIDEHTFHWQSQNATGPENKKGKTIINHEALGVSIHLFVRENKLGPNKKAAPFIYYGPVEYLKHEGSKPMSIDWKLS